MTENIEQGVLNRPDLLKSSVGWSEPHSGSLGKDDPKALVHTVIQALLPLLLHCVRERG